MRTPSATEALEAASPRNAEPSDRLEVEWQFDAPDLRPVRRLLASIGNDGADADGRSHVRILPQAAREQIDLYLDTDDWRVRRSAWSLRLRRSAGAAEATFKSIADPASGIRRRREITEPLELADPQSVLGSDGPVGARVRALAGPLPLRTVLEIRTHREPFVVQVNGQRVGEIALDETTIGVGDERDPVRLHRVEVELVAADSEVALAGLVRTMQEHAGLRPASLTKFELGALAAGLEAPVPDDLGPTEIDASKSIGEVAFAVLRRQFAAFLAKEPGTRLGEEPEDLHDMRVASRRLRAALALFADVLPARAPRLRAELGWVGTALGEIRDLDVQLERLRVWTARTEEPEREALAPVAGVLQRDRARARDHLLRTFDSKRYERMVASFTTMLQRGPLRSQPAARVPVTLVAPDLLAVRFRKVRKAGKAVRERPSAEAFHVLRIRCKRLRYAVESFDEVYGPRAHSFARRVAALQELLGLNQDAVVAVARLRAIASGKEPRIGPATIFQMGRMAERYSGEAARLQRRFPKALRRVTGKRWRSFARVMDDLRARMSRWERVDGGSAQVGPSTAPSEGGVTGSPS